jgi:hypothetical protein
MRPYAITHMKKMPLIGGQLSMYNFPNIGLESGFSQFERENWGNNVLQSWSFMSFNQRSMDTIKRHTSTFFHVIIFSFPIVSSLFHDIDFPNFLSFIFISKIENYLFGFSKIGISSARRFSLLWCGGEHSNKEAAAIAGKGWSWGGCQQQIETPMKRWNKRLRSRKMRQCGGGNSGDKGSRASRHLILLIVLPLFLSAALFRDLEPSISCICGGCKICAKCLF